MIAGGGRWLRIESLVGEWPKVVGKHHKSWWGLLLWVERRRREEERESALKITWCKMNLRQINYFPEN